MPLKMTPAESGERLRELKRMDVPRASFSRLFDRFDVAWQPYKREHEFVGCFVRVGVRPWAGWDRDKGGPLYVALTSGATMTPEHVDELVESLLAAKENAVALMATRKALDAHLRHYAWLVNSAGEMLCPGCATRGMFGWGIVYGHGSCSCGWPGRFYHSIPDPDHDAACRHCGEPKSAHDHEERRPEHVGWGRRCPGVDTWQEYSPRDLARLNMVLWAHPYEVESR